MRTIDFHLHINSAADVNAELRILDKDIKKLLRVLSLQLRQASIDKGLAILLDTRLPKDIRGLSILKESCLSSETTNLAFSIMPDFRDKQSLRATKLALKNGSIRGIKFHPIHQRIVPEDYNAVNDFFLSLDNEKVILTIDTSYMGYSDIYSGLGLASCMLPFIKNPVVFAHAGGLRVLEAVNIALQYKNVYLEASFSIPHYLGSSIEQDIAFAIRKAGPKRCLYGSDAPFIELNFAKKDFEKFLIDHKFNEEEREDIFYNTAYNLLNKKE